MPAAAPDVGDVLAGRYDLLARIGKGGVAQVFHARDRELDQDVALKVLTDRTAASERAFRREVGLARTVHHPNVVAVHDIGRHEDWLFLTMELVEGTPLHLVHAADERVDVARVTHYLLEAARGLAMAHSQGVVHRDIKPRNLMLRDDGRLCILDFGLVLRVDGEDSALGLTGTPYYMSPEQVEGIPLTEATDIFSLGVVVYELLAGAHPYGRNHPVSSAVRRLQPCDTPIEARRPGIDAGLAKLVMAMLAPASERPTAREVAEAAEAALMRDASAPRRPRRRVAVLPFRFDSGPRSETLASLLTEAVLDALASETAVDVFTYDRIADLPADAMNPEVLVLDWSDALEASVSRTPEGVRVGLALVARDGSRWTTRLADVGPAGEDTQVLAGRIARVALDQLTSRTSNQVLSVRAAVRHVLTTRIWDLEPLDGLAQSPWLEDATEPALVGLSALVRWRMARTPLNDDAEFALRRAEALPESSAATWLAIARRAELRGDLAEEGRALREALALDPLDATAIGRLGALRLRLGQAAQGAEDLRRAIRLDPRLVSAWLELHRTAAFASERAEAVWTLGEAARHAGGALCIQLTRARGAAWEGDAESARALAPAEARAALAGGTLPYGELGAQLRLFCCEVALAEGRLDDALQAWSAPIESQVGALAPLPDVDWLRRCPWGARFATSDEWTPALTNCANTAHATLAAMGLDVR